MNSIEQRPITPWRTSTGVVVGGAYRKPAPALSADDEVIQAAILRKESGYDVTSAGERAVVGICVIGCAAFVIWALVQIAVRWH